MIKQSRFNKEFLTGLSRWDFYSFGVMVAIFIVGISEWPRMPYFMDCYYHLGVMRGFADAGGWVGRSFWEFAPIGRPQVYPPLYHILELILFKAGLGVFLIAKLSQLLIYPLFLFTAWGLLKDFFGARLAFFGLFLLSSSLDLYFAIITLLPFSLALIFSLWAFYFFEKSRRLGCFLSLALAFYAHTLMAWLAIVALILYSLFLRKKIIVCLQACLLAVLAAMPLLLHQWKFSSYIHTERVLEFYYVQIHLLLVGLALMGLFLCFKKKGRYFFIIGMSLGMFLLFFIYRNRFLSGQGLVPLCFLAAVPLVEFWQKLEKAPLRHRAIFIFVLTIFSFFLTPVLEISPLQPKPKLLFEARIRLTKKYEVDADEAFRHTESFYYPRLINEIVRLVERSSDPDEIVYSNFNYAGGMVAILAHRATSDAMVSEVEPFKKFDPVAAAQLVLWFKIQSKASFQELDYLISRYGLEKVGETDIAYLYRNKHALFRRQVLSAVVPFWACVALLVSCLGGVLFSWNTCRKEK